MQKKGSYLLKPVVLAIGLLGLAPLASAADFYYGGVYYPSVAAFCSSAVVRAMYVPPAWYIPPACVQAGYTEYYYGPPNENYIYYNNGAYPSGTTYDYNNEAAYPNYYYSNPSNPNNANYHPSNSSTYQYPNYTKYNGAYGGHEYTSPHAPNSEAYTHSYNSSTHQGHGEESIGNSNVFYGRGHSVTVHHNR